MIFISEEDVRALLNWDDTFKAIKAAMESVSKGSAVQNPRTFTRIPDTLLLTMPGYFEDDQYGALGCKLVTASPGNAKLPVPLPTINANVCLFDDKTGIMKAVVAATEITSWRTAAASVVATKYLRDENTKPYKVLAILGAGVQGKIHAEAFHNFWKFDEIRLWNRTTDKASHLAEELNKKHGTDVFKFYKDNEKCVRGADIIITATFASKPIVKHEWIKQGAHINAVGAGVNHYSELAQEVYTHSQLFVDHYPSAKVELAGLLATGVQVKGEVGDVIAGNIYPGAADTTTVFQSMGMAVEDCAMAKLIYDLHTAKQ